MPEWLMIVLRSISLLIVLFFFTKWLGKKQISQLNIFEYITGIVLGGIVALHSIDLKSNFIYGLIAMLIWFLIPLFFDYISLIIKIFIEFIHETNAIFLLY